MSLLLHLSNQTDSSPSNNKALIDEKDCDVVVVVVVVAVVAVVVVVGFCQINCELLVN